MIGILISRILGVLIILSIVASGVLLAAFGQFHGQILPMMLGAAIIVFGVSRKLNGETGVATWILTNLQNHRSTNSNK